MARTTIAQVCPRVTVGVDTHKDVHVARAKDELGRSLGEKHVSATAAGYRELLSWARDLGELEAFGIEGTGSYGAGLARFLLANAGEVKVFEVIRPNRQRRRRNGKSDPADADAAASAVLAGEALAIPKAGDGEVEMIRSLRVARKTAVKARTQAINAMKALIVTAPPELRDELPRARRSVKRLSKTCAAFTPIALDRPLDACQLALRSLARRCQALEAEIAELDAALDELVAASRPRARLALRRRHRVCRHAPRRRRRQPGAPALGRRFFERLRRLAGRGLVRAGRPSPPQPWRQPGSQRRPPPHRPRPAPLAPTHARDYVERRTKDGLSKREIMRCLKRYVAREVYGTLRTVRVVAVPRVT